MSSASYDFPGMEEISKAVKFESDEISEAIQNVVAQINKVPSVWDGASAEAYMDQFTSIKPGLDNAIEVLNSISQQILDVIKIQEEADKEIARQMGVQ